MDSHISAESDGPSFVILDAESIQSVEKSLSYNNDQMRSSYFPPTGSNSDPTYDTRNTVERLMRENRDLKEALSQNNFAMKSQFDTLSIWQQDIFKTHQNHKEKFAETRELILRLREENAKYKGEIQILKNTSTPKCPRCPRLLDELNNTMEHNRKLEAENIILTKERDNFREECTRLHVLLTDNLESAKFRTLSRTIPPNVCSGTGWQCIDSNKSNDSNENAILRKQLADVQEEQARLIEQRNDLKASEANLIIDLKNAQTELNEKDLVLKSAIAELDEKRGRINDLETQRDEMAILKTQVEAYETDYREERAAREALVGQKNELEEEMRTLHQRLQELSGTPSAAPEVQVPANHEAGGVADTSRDSADDEPHPNAYVCFKCETSFPHLPQLQSHVESCLELA